MSGVLVVCTDPRMKNVVGEVASVIGCQASYLTAPAGAAFNIDLVTAYLDDLIAGFGKEAVSSRLDIVNHLGCKKCASLFPELLTEHEADHHIEALLQAREILAHEYPFIREINLWLLTRVEEDMIVVTPNTIMSINALVTA